jgi:hypothetical protein
MFKQWGNLARSSLSNAWYLKSAMWMRKILKITHPGFSFSDFCLKSSHTSRKVHILLSVQLEEFPQISTPVSPAC